jgi:hypothetical protein
MKGTVINQIDNIVTVQVESDSQFKEMEPVKIDSALDTFRDELLALYWVLLGWMTDKGRYWNLPGAEKWFSKYDSPDLVKSKLYTLTRFVADWVDVDYNRDGEQIITARSTAREKCNQQQLSTVYEKTYDFFADHVDMKDFEITHAKAREKLGKFY